MVRLAGESLISTGIDKAIKITRRGSPAPGRGDMQMLRRWLSALGIAAVLALGSAAQTVDEVIAKNIEAHGGMEKLKAVKTIRETGHFAQGSFRAGFAQENKRPEK